MCFFCLFLLFFFSNLSDVVGGTCSVRSSHLVELVFLSSGVPPSYPTRYPITVRSGDVNMDGAPDLLIPLDFGSKRTGVQSDPGAGGILGHLQFVLDLPVRTTHWLRSFFNVASASSSSPSRRATGKQRIQRVDEALPQVSSDTEGDATASEEPLTAGETGVEVVSSSSRMTLWLNVDCTPALCSQAAVDANRHTFVYSADGFSSIEQIPGAFAAAWADMSDSGSLDAFVLSMDTLSVGPGGLPPMKIASFSNALDSDAYFLTTMGENGVCPAWCSTGEKFPSPKVC